MLKIFNRIIVKEDELNKYFLPKSDVENFLNSLLIRFSTNIDELVHNLDSDVEKVKYELISATGQFYTSTKEFDKYLEEIKKEINLGKKYPKDDTEKSCIWCGYVEKKDCGYKYCGNCGARW